MQFTQEHEEIRRTVRNFVDNEINPNINDWEDNGPLPAHELFKKLGDLGILGVTKPEQFGGLGLDYSYGVVVAEELGGALAGGPPMAIGVQMAMATPALSRFGSDELREAYLEEIEAHNRELVRAAAGLSVDLVPIRTDQPLDEVIRTYLAHRSARARGGGLG